MPFSHCPINKHLIVNKWCSFIHQAERLNRSASQPSKPEDPHYSAEANDTYIQLDWRTNRRHHQITDPIIRFNSVTWILISIFWFMFEKIRCFLFVLFCLILHRTPPLINYEGGVMHMYNVDVKQIYFDNLLFMICGINLIKFIKSSTNF